MYFSGMILEKSPITISKLVKARTFFQATVAFNKLDTINMSFTSYESSPVQDGIPPLIIMHGLFGSKSNWNSLSKGFHEKTSPKRKVITVDARNHGDSPHTSTHSYAHMAADITEFLNVQNINKAALLGHSMGGRAMMYVVLKYSQLVDKLIVADVSPVTNNSWENMPTIFTIIQNVSLPNKVSLAAARAAADKQLAKSISSKALRLFILTNVVQKSDGRKSEHPTILKLFPKAEFKVIEDAGHWLHSEKPAEFLQICVEFLNK